MTDRFFELIRVAIGTGDSLTHTPSNKEWKALYAMAKKQSLVGVCFAALQRLGADADEGFARIGMSEMLYLTWMGMAAKIKQKNETLNQQCAVLQMKLSTDGFRSCVLKGQGVATLYITTSTVQAQSVLQGLRQSGDIDIWIDGEKDQTLDWARKQGARLGSIDIVHAHAAFFEDTEVEIHSRPSWMYGRKADKVLQNYFEEMADEQFKHFDQSLGFCYPTVGFNLVYLLVHINRHIFEEGIGFRQLMDYYFVLVASSEAERSEAVKVLSDMGLMKFARGIMYIEQKVFCLDASCMLCEADKSEGEFLLKDILIGGNFGKYDDRNVVLPTEKRFARGWYTLKRNMRYFPHYPSEVIAIPFWQLWHYCWRKRKGYL